MISRIVVGFMTRLSRPMVIACNLGISLFSWLSLYHSMFAVSAAVLAGASMAAFCAPSNTTESSHG